MPRPSLTRAFALCAALLLQVFAPPGFADSFDKPVSYISIILDDIGHSSVSGRRAIDLPANLTYAIIPYAAHAPGLSGYANDAGKEVMLHMPMEHLGNFPLGGIALTSFQTRDDFVSNFQRAMERVPHASGVNNHMGSALTQQLESMSLLMSLVKQRDLYFVDSKTTPNSVASEVARTKNVRSASRDVFLDNEQTLYAIDRQFRYLIRKARRKETAIAIGHPYQATLDYLEYVLPMLEAENIRVIPVSEMLKLRQARQQVATTESAVKEQAQPGA